MANEQEPGGNFRAGANVMAFYRTVVELGTAELVQHRERSYDNIKINMAIATGIGLVMFLAVGHRYATFFISILIIFGITTCYQWIRQIRESLSMLGVWRAVAANIESSDQFRSAVDNLDVKAWSRPEIGPSVEKGMKVEDPSGKHHVWVATLWILFYVIVAVIQYLRLLEYRAGS